MQKAIRRLLVGMATLLIVGSAASAQSTNQLNICHAGSLSAAFTQLENQFRKQNPGVTIKDSSGGSLDMVRHLANGAQQCDIYASADYTNISLLLKPAGLADYNIVFAQGRMVLGYVASNPNTTGIAASGDFNPPNSVPQAVPNWYQILLSPGVRIGGVHPYLDPSSYRSHLIFQLAQNYYRIGTLYNDLLAHYVAFSLTAVTSSANAVSQMDRGSDFQFSYEHGAQARAKKDPDYRYVYLPDSVDLSNSDKNSAYSQATVVVPGLGIPRAAPSVSIPATRVAWGITVLKSAPNQENAVKFLQLLLGSTGAKALTDNGPAPITPAMVNKSDYRKLPALLKPLVRAEKVEP